MSISNPIRIFISYSRTDHEFVDRLEADLIAKHDPFIESLEAALKGQHRKRSADRLEADLTTQRLAVWVDRRRIEGGQEWWREIKNEIHQSDIVLLVLSPDALDSPWVKKEYKHAIWYRKPLIPLLYHPVSRAPRALKSRQWISVRAGIDFERVYPEQFSELLKAIAAITIDALAARRRKKLREIKNLARDTNAQAKSTAQTAQTADAVGLSAQNVAAPAEPSPLQRGVSGVPTMKALNAFDRWMLAISVSIVMAGLAVLGIVGVADVDYHIALSSITVGAVECVTIVAFTLIGGIGIRAPIYRRGRISTLRRISQGIALALFTLAVQVMGVWGAAYAQIDSRTLTSTIAIAIFGINLTTSGILSVVTILS